MSSRYKVHNSQIPHFITFTVVGWVDVFSREQYKEIFCDSLRYCQEKKGLILHAWVIMTNHAHLIVSTESPHTIEEFTRDCKKFTSTQITEAIRANNRESRQEWMLNMFGYVGRNNHKNMDTQFWQQDYHPVMLDSMEKVNQRLTYLHENPVRAGLVWRPEDFKYSSAVDYYTERSGLLGISKIY